MSDAVTKKKNTLRDKVYKSKKHAGIKIRLGSTVTYNPKHPGILTEKNIMSEDTYSKSEIDLKLDKINSDVKHSFEKNDLKFDQLQKEMQSSFEKIDLKLDNFEKQVESLLLTQENKILEEQAKNKKEFMYWFIGLLVSTLLGILAIIVTILTTK